MIKFKYQKFVFKNNLVGCKVTYEVVSLKSSSLRFLILLFGFLLSFEFCHLSFLLIPIMFRFIRTFYRDSDIIRLFFGDDR